MKRPAAVHLRCAICEAASPEAYELLYSLPGYEVVRCESCGLLFVNSLFDVKEKEGGEVYASTVYADIATTLRERFKEDIEELARLLPVGKLLDVGCGYGYFLSVAREAGWEVTGVEINKRLVDWLRQEKGINAFAGILEAQAFADEGFDAVTMFNIIEHLLYPSATLREVNRILKVGGILLLEAPTEDGLMKKLGALLYHLTGGRFTLMIRGAYQKGGHHHGFSRKSITLILKKNGFRVSRVRGRMSPFIEFMRKELLDASPSMKLVKSVAVPVIWGASKLLGMENRMVVCAQKIKEIDQPLNTAL